MNKNYKNIKHNKGDDRDAAQPVSIGLHHMPVSEACLTVCMLIFPYMIGLTYTWGVAAVSVLCTIFILYHIHIKRGLNIYISKKTIAGVVIVISSLITVFADRAHGDALIGFFRLAACFLFVMVLMNIGSDHPEKRENGTFESAYSSAFGTVPVSGASMVIISSVIYFTPARSVLFESGRMAGFYQYSNTFALFLLIGLAVMLSSYSGNASIPAHSIVARIVCLIILIIGILWSGSRLTFLLTVITLVVIMIKDRRKAKPYADRTHRVGRYATILLLMMLILSAIAFFALSGDASFGRIFTLSSSSSTALGRIIYWKDALPLVVKHPFGLGYRGYYHVETQIAHGVYSIRNVHNDYIQAALDHGWLALAGFLFLVADGARKLRGGRRLILFIISVHCFFEFDLEYLYIGLVFLMLFDWKEGKKIVIRKKPYIMTAVITGICCISVSVWLFCGSILWQVGSYMIAQRAVPFSSLLSEDAMMNASSPGYGKKMAEHILEMYPEDVQALGTMADVYMLKVQSTEYDDRDCFYDDIKAMLRYKWKSVRYAPYHYESIREFTTMLASLEETDDKELAGLAYRYDGQLKRLIRKTEETTDPIAYKLRDKPKFSEY